MKKFLKGLKKLINHIRSFWSEKKYPHVDPTARIDPTARVYNVDNLYMAEKTNIEGSAVIMNTRAKFIMKKYSGAAIGLSVITGNHMSVPGKHHKMVTDADKDALDVNHEYDRDVIIGEDVWLAVNVTLLSGVTIGRGAIVGAGAVVRYDVPPYAIVAGNPAKVVGFRFTPSIIVQHEEELYPEDERLPAELLQENYKKYFVSKIKDIQQYLSL
jgi:acetyltransferase-like isoleucine patch superfamily enzyme